MMAAAEKYAAEDAIFKERVEAKNGLENYAFAVKNALRSSEHADSDAKKQAEAAVTEVLAWIESNAEADKGEIDAKRATLENTCAPILSNAGTAQGEGVGGRG